MAKRWSIYCHTTPSGKRYIGQTRQEPEKRWRGGSGYRYIDTPHFYNAIEKYGWDNIKHTILCQCTSQENADFLEQWFIAKYETCDRSKGYNLTVGGPGSPGRKLPDKLRASFAASRTSEVWTEERRKKVSDTLKRKYANGEIVRKPISEETREKQRLSHLGPRNHNYGKKKSEETKRRMSESQRGRKLTDEQKKKLSEAHLNSSKVHRKSVHQFSLDGEYLNSYISMKEAERETGILGAAISSCCHGKSRTSGGYIWCFQDRPETFPSPVEGLFS